MLNLLAVASQSWPDQCYLTAFVPAYRCGAVPDSHRIPSCAPGVSGRPA